MTDDLSRVLAQAYRIPFVHLMHLVERLQPASTQVGGDGPPERESVRFKHDPSLAFHASDVERATQHAVGQPVEVVTRFLGLTGAASPLPMFFVDELQHDDESAQLSRDLLDLFHHRLLSLLVRGLLGADHARSYQQPARDPVSRCVLLPSGIAPERVMAHLEPALLLRLSPLLVLHPPSAERLRSALQDALCEVLGAGRVEVVEYAGGFVQVGDDELPRVGESLVLGITSTLGRRVAAPASKLLIRIAPLTREACEKLGPDGSAFPLLRALTELMLPESLDYDIELQPESAVPMRLGGAAGHRLGRSSWLGQGKPAPLRFSGTRAHARHGH
jgi:type VI secretion system protein ImpH